MINFIMKLYTIIIKIFIIILCGAGLIVACWYPLELLLGPRSEFATIMGIIAAVVYGIVIINHLIDGDFKL